MCKQWTTWSDATFCGVWSGFALFADVPQKKRYAYMGKKTIGVLCLAGFSCPQVHRQCSVSWFSDKVTVTGVQSNFIQFTGVIACITKFMKENRVKIEKKQGPIFCSLIEVIQKQKKGSHNIYLNLNKSDDIPTGKIKWNKIYEISDQSWGYIYKSPYQLTKCTKLRWFQTSINNRILPTNHLLNKMNISDDPKCTFCGEENETYSHQLWNCSHTKAFITELKTQLQYKSIILDLNEKRFILSLYPNIMLEIIQLLMLIVKYYIYMCRNNKCAMNFKVYKLYVKTFYQTQREIALSNNDIENFPKKMVPIPMVNSVTKKNGTDTNG